MTAQSQIYSGAFADPVFEAQSVFRSLMDCFARPGIIGRLSTAAAPPAPLGEASGAVALTLCDHDTPVWLSPALSKSSAPKWIAFHTGAGVTDTKDEPRFAFFEKGAAVPGFDQFALGTQEYPDRSTTLVVEVEALEGGQPLIGRDRESRTGSSSHRRACPTCSSTSGPPTGRSFRAASISS